ncbi:hypothetical protein BDF22DRAFT_664555 [Syncephalis plumigaleata]|nr:hypothetical protein BDF22DRAFT_664555 [Syncephalis plumigaleata]
MQAIFTYSFLALHLSAQYNGQTSQPNRASSKTIEMQMVSPGDNKVWFGDKVEGTAVDKEGNIYSVDISADNKNPNHAYINGVRFVHPRPGAKGGRALAVDVINHRVIELTWPDAKTPEALQGGDSANYNRTVFCQDSTMIQPNDLAVSPNGKHVYLSGMKGETNTGSGDVWLCDDKGTAKRIDLMGRTNGIEGEYLYVTEAVGGWTPTAGYIGATNLIPTLKEKFFDFQEYDKTGNIDCDGMRFDKNGFLYVTRNGSGTVVKISPGKTGESIKLPFQKPTNLEFGGSNGETLYVVGTSTDAKPEEKIGCVAKGDTGIIGRAANELRRKSSKSKPADNFPDKYPSKPTDKPETRLRTI